MSEQKPHLTKQLTVVGYTTCGKTSILNRHTEGTFSNEFVSTIFSTRSQDYKYPEGTVTLSLWDTAGQEDFGRIRHLTLHSADFVLMCFSVDSRKSFKEITDNFMPLVSGSCPDSKFYLVASKIDLRDDPDTQERLKKENDTFISFDEGIALAKEIKAAGYFECSAKDNIGIDNIFVQITKHTLKEYAKDNRGFFGKLCDSLNCCAK